MADLDARLADVVAPWGLLSATPTADQTVRSLPTMTRGATVDGPYDNGAAHLLAHVLTAAVGEPVDVFAARELFAPLGISRWRWWKDPDGVPYGDAHLFLSAEALSTLGQLWLNGGVWGGRTIVAADSSRP